MSKYILLTPEKRRLIVSSIDKQLEELNTCNSNAYVNASKCGLHSLRNIIKALPDGYPLPVTERKVK